MVEGVYLANWEVHNPKEPFLSPGARFLVSGDAEVPYMGGTQNAWFITDDFLLKWIDLGGSLITGDLQMCLFSRQFSGSLIGNDLA